MSDSIDANAFEIFDEVCDLPSTQRAAVLNERCGDNDALRSLVEQMLSKDDDVASGGRIEPGLGAGLVGQVDDSVGTPEIPKTIGAYRIVGIIGQGGMGIVYEAEQENPKRRVALKVVRHGLDTPSLRQRFHQEAHVLGQLKHPGIAQVYEAGSARVGQATLPYFAMEYLDGVPLTRAAQNLEAADRIELVARICDAVQHAHQKGVVHRDLKPANILVIAQATSEVSRTGSLADRIGQPKVLDFGIARLLDSDAQLTTIQTQAGQIVGTLAYMSPEQVTGDSRLVDTRSDVYALGVILFELMTGRPPYDLSGKAIVEAGRVIKEGEPQLAGTINHELRGDVETIIAKAIEKEPDRRYDSAADLANDLRRYLRHEPIEARQPSAFYQFRKFAARHRAVVGGVVASFVLLLLGVTGTTIGLSRALRAQDQLEQRNTELEDVVGFQASQLARLDVERMGTDLRAFLLSVTPIDDRSVLDQALSHVNFTSAALDNLKRNVFDRTQDAIDERFEDQPFIQARMLETMASTLQQLGLPGAAIKPAEKALTLRKDALGEADSASIDSLALLGRLRLDLGEFDDAERIVCEVIELRTTNLGPDHVGNLDAQFDLGAIQLRRGDFSVAIKTLREVADQFEVHRGPDSPSTMKALATLGVAYRNAGDHEQALTVARDALDRRRQALGPKHADTLNSLSNVASALREQGRFADAIPLQRDVLEIRRQALGDDHPKTLNAMANLAETLLQVNELSESESLAREAFERRSTALGPDHRDTLTALNNLASVLDSQGLWDKAEPLYRESLERHRRALGDDHLNTLLAMGNLGYALNALGDVDAAEQLYRDSLAGRRRTLGDNHRSTLNAIGNLAVLLLNSGRAEEAEPLYYESLNRRRESLGDDHPSTLNAIYNMGNMLMRVGKLDEAEPYCVDALAKYQKLLGENHIGALYSLSNLGELRLQQGRLDDAQKLYKEALERRTKVFGPDHPETKQIASKLESIRDLLERADGAAALNGENLNHE